MLSNLAFQPLITRTSVFRLCKIGSALAPNCFSRAVHFAVVSAVAEMDLSSYSPKPRKIPSASASAFLRVLKLSEIVLRRF